MFVRRVHFFSSKFKTINVANYGNCFMFNSVYNNQNDTLAGERVSSLTGPSFGLILVLELDWDNYMQVFTTQVR